jgi:hypothetical protein
VDISAILGGFASLIAVWIAVRGLRAAGQVRREASLRRHLEMLQDVALEVARLGTALDNTSHTTSALRRRQIRVLLALAGWRTPCQASTR